jgi:hypothetical protein
MGKSKRAAPRGVLGWAIIRERGEDVAYYRGPMFGADASWTDNADAALGFMLRREARQTQTGYIDQKIDQTRIVPVRIYPKAPQ